MLVVVVETEADALSFPLLVERVKLVLDALDTLGAVTTLFRSLPFLAFCEGCEDDEDTFDEIEYPVAGVVGFENGDVPR